MDHTRQPVPYPDLLVAHPDGAGPSVPVAARDADGEPLFRSQSNPDQEPVAWDDLTGPDKRQLEAAGTYAQSQDRAYIYVVDQTEASSGADERLPHAEMHRQPDGTVIAHRLIGGEHERTPLSALEPKERQHLQLLHGPESLEQDPHSLFAKIANATAEHKPTGPTNPLERQR